MRVLIVGKALGKIRKLELHYDMIISVDGAIKNCLNQDIVPSIIIGDMDSVPTRQRIPRAVKYLRIEDQNTTDLEKSIVYADTLGAKEIHIVNVLGGLRLDHTIYNIRLLRKYAKSGRRVKIFYRTSLIEFFSDTRISLIGEIGWDIAFMAFPKATVTTFGLQYEMKEYSLDFALSEGPCNKFAARKVQAIIKGEILSVYPMRSRVTVTS